MNNEFIENLREYFDNKGITQRKIAEDLGVSPAYVNKLLIGKKAFGKKTAQQFQELYGLSAAWLLTMEGDMLKEADSTAARPDDEPSSEQSVTALPLIPVNALAGALSGSDLSVMEYECERYIVPILKGAEFLIRVQGDSMIPKYSSGDIVACQRVPLDGLWFQWGKTYVIDTRQGALIKRIEPSEKEGCISIHSENPRYKPFDLPKEEINGVALVRGIIRVE